MSMRIAFLVKCKNMKQTEKEKKILKTSKIQWVEKRMKSFHAGNLNVRVMISLERRTIKQP